MFLCPSQPHDKYALDILAFVRWLYRARPCRRYFMTSEPLSVPLHNEVHHGYEYRAPSLVIDLIADYTHGSTQDNLPNVKVTLNHLLLRNDPFFPG